MNFTNPWGFLLIFLLPVIVLFHMRRKQIAEHSISNLEFWQEVIKEVEGVKRRRISKYLLLLIQLLAASLIVLAFAGPSLSNESEREYRILIIDNSLPMQSLEEGVTHLDRAKEKAVEYIEGAGRDLEYTVIAVSDIVKVMAEGEDGDDAVKAVKDIELTNKSLDIDDFSVYLSSGIEGAVFISNRNLHLSCEEIIVAETYENIGIIDAKYDYYEDTLMVSVKNYGRKKRETSISIHSYGDDRGFEDKRDVVIEGGDTAYVNYRVKIADGVYHLNIDGADVMAADDTYIVNLGENNKKSVLLRGRNAFLEAALESLRNVRCELVEDIDMDMTGHDLLIVVEKQDLSGFDGKIAVWDMCEGDEYGESIDVSGLDYLSKEIGKNLDFDNIVFMNTRILDIGDEDRILMSKDDRPIMVCKTCNGFALIRSSFDLSMSNLVMEPQFPVFVSNVIGFATGESSISYHVGDRIHLEDENEARLYFEGEELKGNRGTFVFGEPGIYELRKGTELLRTYTVNLTACEMDVETGGIYYAGKDGGKPWNNNSVPLLAGAVMILMILEWEIFKYEY